jgi:Flp pilus assembly protein TadG
MHSRPLDTLPWRPVEGAFYTDDILNFLPRIINFCGNVLLKESKTGSERTRPPGSSQANLRIVNDLPSRIAVRQTAEGADMDCSLWNFPLSVGSVIGRVAAGCCRFAAALARDRRGMSAVEFGVAAPIFLAILMPVIDLGRAYSQQIQIRQAVQAGALYASVNVYNTGTWSTSVQNAVTNSLATSLSSDPTFSATVGSETCGCPNGTSTDIISHDTVTTCGPSNGGTNCSDGSRPGYYVTVTGSLSYTPIMPYSILANPTTLSDQAVVRIQ